MSATTTFMPDTAQYQQLCRVMQFYAAQLTPAQALEVASIFPEFAPGVCYETGAYLRRGYNAVGDPQLYQVTLDHLSASDRLPEYTPELYEPLGLDGQGHPLWSAPAGDQDGYQPGDIVRCGVGLYRCLSPDCLTHPEGAPLDWQFLSGC